MADRRYRALRWVLGSVLAAILAVGAFVAFVVVGAGGLPTGSAPTGGCAVHPADPARLRAHVELLATTLQPRDFAHPEGLDRVADQLARELRALGAGVREQPYDVAGHTFRNLIARFGPESPELIVVGAHYDTAGAKPGADDNASGVAGLLELARLLASNPPPSAVELVAFTLEEPPNFPQGSMGSAVHAASLAAAGAKVRAMMSLEMIGYFSDAPLSQAFPLQAMGLVYPTVGNFITVVGNLGHLAVVRETKRAMRSAGGVAVESIDAPAFVPGIDFSDHRNYWKHGYAALMVTDTAFFRNPNYHSDEDLPDTLDYVRMARVVEAVDCAVRALGR